MKNNKLPKHEIVEKKTPSISYETLTIDQTISALQTDANNGLSEEEAKKRLEKYGENKLQEKKKKSWVRIFFEQMNNPMIFVLFAAIAVIIGTSVYEVITTLNAGLPVSFLETGDWPDVIIILAVILLNSIIGTVQEIKAQTSLDALKKLSSPETTVIRDGKRKKVKSSSLVIGDVIVLEEGDTIGADIRLIESINLKANESSLTGESVPVEKDANIVFSESVGIGDQNNMAFMSTPVSYGRGKGIVTSTGMSTQIGKIATALESEEEEETPLQKVLAKLSKFLGILTLIIVVVVLLVDIVWIFIDGNGSSFEAWIEAILSSIALAVAAIPEGLSAVVTIVLSIGMQRMSKVNTIVRKLPSVETLGAVSVVCSDKTGTLTQNKMTVVGAYTNKSYYESESFNKDNKDVHLRLLASGMSLCSNATVDEGLYGDPTEIALVSFANEFDLHKKELESTLPRIDELPFDSVRKMMSTKHKKEDKHIIFTKGALDSILAHTKYIYEDDKVRKITKEDIETIYKINSYYSSKALRVLALAFKEDDSLKEEDLVFVGVVAMIDPPRKEAKPAVSAFKGAGITTVMITGDHKDTAYAIAKDLGICSSIDECMSGSDIDLLNEEQLKEKVKSVRVFARVSPENKVSIVKAFKANGNICAMTGDGVNDAPSLKAADIGIAMGITGTDVAKGAADMVLTDDNFASIEKAVEEGRNIFANIKKTVLFLLSSNIAEVLAMLFIIILGLPTPLIAIHLLWVNLITDSMPAIALGMDKKDKNIMNEKPRDPKENFFSNGGMAITIGYGAALTLAVLLAYFSCGWLHGSYSISAIKALYETNEVIKLQAQTMAFTTLAFGELFHMIGMSDIHLSFFSILKKKNWMMFLAFFIGIALQLIVIEVPGISMVFKTHNLDWQEWIITAVMSIIPLIIHEIIVLIRFIKLKIKKDK
ncbi:MAG: cation-translocating P-type ATPase [Bacilli bacterium]